MSDTGTATWSEKLGILLKYDYWDWELGLPTLVGIDGGSSSYSDAFNVGRDSELDLDRYAFENYETVSLLQEGDREALPAIGNPDQSDIGYALQSVVSGDYLRQLDDEEDSALRENLRSKLVSRDIAVKTLVQYKELFFSNPEHTEDAVFPPTYFVGWAKEKGLKIPWLDWALSAGLLLDSEIDAATTHTNMSGQPIRDEDIRRSTERITHYVFIAALLKKLDIDWNERGIAGSIVCFTEELGAPLGDDTVRKILKRLDDAVERRSKS